MYKEIIAANIKDEDAGTEVELRHFLELAKGEKTQAIIAEFLKHGDQTEREANEILNRYSFLNNWLLIEANWSHNNNSLKWANINYHVENWISEEHFTNDDLLGKIQNGFEAKDKVFDKERIEFNEIIPPMEGKLRPRERAPYLIENFEGLDISEASLYFLGMFLLGSLVRYMPNIWIHSLILIQSPHPINQILKRTKCFLTRTIGLGRNSVIFWRPKHLVFAY